jgi:transposase
MVGWILQQQRSGGPTPARPSFTPAQKLEHLASYKAAVAGGTGGAYLREQGLYSSQITEWRKLRDASVLAGKSAGARVGRPTAEQAEIARLRRQLDVAERRLNKTEAAPEDQDPVLVRTPRPGVPDTLQKRLVAGTAADVFILGNKAEQVGGGYVKDLSKHRQ